MKLQYLVSAIAMVALIFTVQPSNAEIPSQIKSCLVDPNYVTPKQYREFARVKDGGSTYVFLHSVRNPSEVPTSSVLLKLEGAKCKRVGGHFLNPFEDVSRLVPQRVAIVLTEAKWRSILKFKDGKQFIRDILNPREVRNEMGENLASIKLGQMDMAALRKIGVR